MSETASAIESSDASPVVRVADVRKIYDLGGTVTALDGVSLTLDKGSYTAVMGPSGSGKSTLLNLIGALDTPTDGRIRVAGHDIGTASENERATLRGTEVGFIFQTFNLMPRSNAIENVALPLVFDGWSRERRRERAREVLTQVGLDERTDHQPTELSGGQRQRVAIARALAPDPAVVLADEPTGNVDTETGSEIMALLDETNTRGNTILLVTHERHIAEYADRIVHIRDGVIESIENLDTTGEPANGESNTPDGLSERDETDPPNESDTNDNSIQRGE